MKTTLLLLCILLLSVIRAQNTDGNDDNTDNDPNGDDNTDDNDPNNDNNNSSNGDDEDKEVKIVGHIWDDGEAMLRDIQGIGESTMWIVQFFDDDKENDLMEEIADCLGEEKYQKDTYQDLTYVVSEVNINDKRYKSAMSRLGMTANDFTPTYPVGLVMF